MSDNCDNNPILENESENVCVNESNANECVEVQNNKEIHLESNVKNITKPAKTFFPILLGLLIAELFVFYSLNSYFNNYTKICFDSIMIVSIFITSIFFGYELIRFVGKQMNKRYDDFHNLLNQNEELKKECVVFLNKQNDDINAKMKSLIDNQQSMAAILNSVYEEQIKNTINQIHDISSDLLNRITENFINRTEQMINNQTETFSKAYNDILEQHIARLSENQNDYSNDLSNKLKDYSESLVEKGRIVIEEVQKENNLELQKLSSSLKDLSDANKKFIDDCDQNNLEISSHIENLTSEYENLFERLNDISQTNINGVNDILQQNLDELNIRITDLNEQQVELFSDAMSDYRDKFVKANANALAEVQSDMTEKVSDAYLKVSELSEIVKKESVALATWTSNLRDCFDNFFKDFKDASNNSNDYLSDNIYELKDNCEKEIKKFVVISTERYEEYNKSIQSIIENIDKIFNQMSIMNGLTEKDINILQDLLNNENG